MSFLHKNIAVVFVFLVPGVLAWLYGGCVNSVVRPVLPWLVAFMVEMGLCFPQKHEGETTDEARRRVWKGVSRDPLTWVSVAFLALMCVPFSNVGFTPPVKIIPYCIEPEWHYNVLQWFLAALPTAVIARHALTRSGKRLLVEMLVWNSVALAVLGFVQLIAEAPGPLWADSSKNPTFFFSTFGYPNMAGDYFAVMFCLSVAQWRSKVDYVRHEIEHTRRKDRIPRHKLFWMKNYYFIPMAINFFAAVNTLSRAAIMLVSLSAVLLFAHTMVVSLARLSKAERVKAGAFHALIVMSIAIAVALFMPDGVHREMKTVDSRGTLDRVTGRGENHTTMATQIWREHLLFGCGGWGYARICDEMIPAGTYRSPGSAHVHNDHLQFLAEHGLVGYGLLVAAVVLLMLPVGRSWITLSKGVRFLPVKRQPPPPQSFFALPGAAFAALVAATIPLVHAFGDCPLRSPAILTLFYATLACIPGYLPREQDKENTSSEEH